MRIRFQTILRAGARAGAMAPLLGLLALPATGAAQTPASVMTAPATMQASVASDASGASGASDTAAARTQGRAGGLSMSTGGREPAVRFNVLFHVGGHWLTAKDSFDAILGQSNGVVFGGGGEAVLRSGIFIRGDVSRFNEEGERVFVSNGQVFPLGQPLTITLTPIEFTGGYRFARRGPAARRGPRLVPYAGGGVGIVRYREESDSDASSERISDSFTSYHVLGGLDIAFNKMFSAGAEFHHRWVPDGLGEGGVSQAFDETDLGGSTFRALFRVHF